MNERCFDSFRVAQEVLKYPNAPEDVAMHKNDLLYICVFSKWLWIEFTVGDEDLVGLWFLHMIRLS